MNGPISSPRVLITTRLILRPPTVDDFPDSFALWSDPQVVQHIGGRPFSEEEVWARLLRYAGHWALLGYGYWTARALEDDRFIGELGFADFRRGLKPGFDGAPEAGWVLARTAQGRGFAREALTAVLAWGEAHFGPGARTVCMIAPENTPSLRLAERMGYRKRSSAPTFTSRPAQLRFTASTG